MTKILLFLLTIPILSYANETAFLYDASLQIETGTSTTTNVPNKHNGYNGISLEYSPAFYIKQNTSIISSLKYNSETDLELYYIGAMYDDISLTFGKQPTIFDLYADSNYTFGMGGLYLGKYFGGSIQDRTAKLYAEIDNITCGVSYSIPNNNDIKNIIAYGMKYKFNNDIFTSYSIMYVDGVFDYRDFHTTLAEADRITIGYENEIFAISFSDEHITGANESSDVYFLSSKYNINDFTLSASFSYRDSNTVSGKTATIGVEYELYNDLYVSIEYLKDLKECEYCDSGIEIRFKYEYKNIK